jgi:hypothetical protein
VLRESRALKIDPTDNAFDDLMTVREIEEKCIVVFMLSGLNGDTSVESGLFQDYLEVGGKEISFNDFHFSCDPGIFNGVIVPEVLVAIDFHAESGYGASI